MPTDRRSANRGFVRLGPAHAEVVAKRLGDLLADPHDRVQRGHRVLEYHRHRGAPYVLHGLLVEDLAALEPHAAALDRAAGGDQSHDRPAEDGLARAGLADDSQGLALFEGERDVLDGVGPGPARS